MKIGQSIILIFLCAFGFNALDSQSPLELNYHLQGQYLPTDTAGVLLYRIDSFQINGYLDTIGSSFHRKGFLSAAADSISCKEQLCDVYLFIGKPFFLKDININTNDQILLEGTNIQGIDWSKRILNQENIDQFKAQVVSHLATIGYPFAQIYFDTIIIDEENIAASLIIDKQDFIVYDTLEILGNASIDKGFLARYLEINPGKAYNQDQILKLKDIIRSTSYLQFKADPSVSFLNKKAKMLLPLVNQNASKFDFIIGLLPTTENGIRKFTITGDFTGDFTNKLGYGEYFSIQYRRLRPETQNLELQLNYPYFLKLPFGVDGSFTLFRNTTNFLNLNANFGIDYRLGGRDRLKIGWNLESSRLIEVDTARILALRQLPEQLDVRVTAGDAMLVIDRLNYLFNPSSGFLLKLRLNVGQKTIIPNATITSLSTEAIDFREAYDTLQLRSLQAEIRLDFDYFLKVQDWATLRVANRSAFKLNQSTIFENEYYRVGGNRLLRGFNEESIFTPAYSIFTSEFRILLDQLSYISLPFIDYGRMQVLDLDRNLIWDNAWGIGLGMNFGTPAGIFNISFANGSRLGSGFNFAETKIHFGYVNLF